MKRKLANTPAGTRGQTVTHYVGHEVRADLERAAVLLQQSEGNTTPWNSSQVIRVALRRLLLSLLADRSHPDDPRCVFMAEYLAVLDRACRAREYPHPITLPPRSEEHTPRKTGRRDTKRRKTP